MRVFEMCCSINGDYLIAGDFEKIIQIWDTKKDVKICEMKTHFLSCGQRRSVSNSGKFFSAVNYGRYGVELYSTEDKSLVWQNKEIKQIQGVYFSADDSILYAVNNDKKLYALSVSDGSIQSIEKGVEWLYLSEYGMIKAASLDEITYENTDKIFLERKYVAVYPIKDGFCYSLEGTDGLYCCDSKGSIKWKAVNDPRGNFIKLIYDKDNNAVSAVEDRISSNPDKKSDYYIYSFDAGTGRIICSNVLQCDDKTYCFAFADQGKKLITNSGEIFIFNGKEWILTSVKYNF